MSNRYYHRLSHYTVKLKLWYDGYNKRLYKVDKLRKMYKTNLAYRIKDRKEHGKYVNPLGVKTLKFPF